MLARVHDDGSSHKDDPAPGRLYVAHDPGDPPNADLDAALGRHVVRHEREVRAAAIAELRRHADARKPADDAISRTDVAQLPALGAFRVDDDGGVHSLASHGDPLPANAHLGPLIGRRVEILGRAAVAIGIADERIVLGRGMAPKWYQRFEQRGERWCVGRGDLERQPGEFIVRAPDIEGEHFEGSASLDDHVENACQQLRVDEMPFGTDNGRWLGDSRHAVGVIIEARAWLSRGLLRPGGGSDRCSGEPPHAD